MKNLHKTIFTLLFLAAILISAAQEKTAVKSETGKMIVKIDNASSDKGVLMLGLYKSKETFENSRAFKAAKVEIHNGKAEYIFEDVPFGNYAIKCYHDENLNSRMDANMLGIPTESYGFSNNAPSNFGPADYSDAKFLFEKDGQHVEFSLN